MESNISSLYELATTAVGKNFSKLRYSSDNRTYNSDSNLFNEE